MHVQGNCSEPSTALIQSISGVPLQPMLPAQCLVIADMKFMNTNSAQGGMWLDGLYFRYQASTREPQADFGIKWNGDMLYMTAVTIQGDGAGMPHCDICGASVVAQDEGGEVGGLYAEGVGYCTLL